jgi:hypothetical protein
MKEEVSGELVMSVNSLILLVIIMSSLPKEMLPPKRAGEGGAAVDGIESSGMMRMSSDVKNG